MDSDLQLPIPFVFKRFVSWIQIENQYFKRIWVFFYRSNESSQILSTMNRLTNLYTVQKKNRFVDSIRKAKIISLGVSTSRAIEIEIVLIVKISVFKLSRSRLSTEINWDPHAYKIIAISIHKYLSRNLSQP